VEDPARALISEDFPTLDLPTFKHKISKVYQYQKKIIDTNEEALPTKAISQSDSGGIELGIFAPAKKASNGN
jgi:hypothetical protein